MIPRVVHYFWFSGSPLPPHLRRCLESWSAQLRGYTLRKWTLDDVEIDCEFARRARDGRRWAFLTDYFRFKAVHDQGGIYLDADVYVVKPFDDLLARPSFWGFAGSRLVEPVVFGSHAGNELIADVLAHYRALKGDAIDLETYNGPTTVITPIFERHGLAPYDGRTQELAAGVVFPPSYFCPLPLEEADTRDFLAYRTPQTYAIHLWDNAWFDEFRLFWRGRYAKGLGRALDRLIARPLQPLAYYRGLLYHLRRFLAGLVLPRR